MMEEILGLLMETAATIKEFKETREDIQ